MLSGNKVGWRLNPRQAGKYSLLDINVASEPAPWVNIHVQPAECTLHITGEGWDNWAFLSEGWYVCLWVCNRWMNKTEPNIQFHKQFYIHPITSSCFYFNVNLANLLTAGNSYSAHIGDFVNSKLRMTRSLMPPIPPSDFEISLHVVFKCPPTPQIYLFRFFFLPLSI